MVDGMDPARIRAIIDVAVAQFEGYALLRKFAMDRKLKLSQVAQQLIDAADLLGA